LFFIEVKTGKTKMPQKLQLHFGWVDHLKMTFLGIPIQFLTPEFFKHFFWLMIPLMMGWIPLILVNDSLVWFNHWGGDSLNQTT